MSQTQAKGPRPFETVQELGSPVGELANSGESHVQER